MNAETTSALFGSLSAQPYRRIAILGAGSWGTALASVARRAGREVVMWGRDEALLKSISEKRRHPKYFTDVELPEGISGTTNLTEAVSNADAVLFVTPSTTVRDICSRMAPALGKGVPVVICAKGIEAGTGLLLSEVANQVLDGNPVGALSGPTFAKDTAEGHYSAATIAFDFAYADRITPENSPAARLAVSMGSQTFRPYISDDLVGVEVGGAVKNVIAIACGMMTGAGFAENTRAALIVQGMEEMKTMAVALGGRRPTVSGLSGAGDLTLTCSSTTSRNMSLGQQLGSGKTRAECFDGQPVVVEGEVNARSVHDLGKRLRLHLPICETVFRCLHEGADLHEEFAKLWARPIEAEPVEMDLAFAHPMGGEVDA